MRHHAQVGVAASPPARTRTDRAPGLAVRVVAVGGALLAVSGSAVMIISGQVDGWLSSGSAVLGVLALTWGAVGLSVARHQPGNRVAWALAASAFAGVAVACIAAESLMTGAVPTFAEGLGDSAGAASSTAGWLRPIALAASTIGVLVPLAFGLLLFPEGSLPSPSWRAAGLLAGLAIAGQCAIWLLASQLGRTEDRLDSPALVSTLLMSGFAVLVGVSALAGGLRTGPGILRQQWRWVTWGAAVCGIALAGGIAVAGAGGAGIATLTIACGIVVLGGSYAAAMRRRWLHEIDKVLSQSLVYAALATFVVLVSIGSLIAASRLSGGGSDTNLVVAIVATTGIAAGFRPLRGRLETAVERAILGRTATPHRVLSEFGRRVGADGEDPLAVVARSLVEATGAVRARVRLETGGVPIQAAEWPSGPSPPIQEESRFVVSHGGTTLGVIVLDVPSGGRLSPEDDDLAEQVASWVGLALRNGMLAATLEQRVAQLRSSRRRLIALQDETRRRLERDLHDGAQQQLVALRVKLGLARVIAGRDGASKTGAAIDALASLADTAIDTLRDLARGVYPPLLESEGLAASLASEARRAPFPATLRVEGLERYHRDVEATVYLCVVEGLRQAVEAGTRDEVIISATEMDGRLTFRVSRAGSRGRATVDAPDRESTARLAALVDRVDALSGELSDGGSPETPDTILAGGIPIGDGAAP